MAQQEVIFDKEKKDNNNNNNHNKNAGKQLNHLAQESARVLLEIKTVFPFTLFPDILILDETKVSMHISYFFYTKEVRSIEYKDIFNVVIQQGLFFAKLEIIDRYFVQRPIILEYLKRNEAIHARRIIQGMVIAKKENIPIENVSIEQLIPKLDRIGQTR